MKDIAVSSQSTDILLVFINRWLLLKNGAICPMSLL